LTSLALGEVLGEDFSCDICIVCAFCFVGEGFRGDDLSCDDGLKRSGVEGLRDVLDTCEELFLSGVFEISDFTRFGEVSIGSDLCF
jgi:hypothetical protein